MNHVASRFLWGSTLIAVTLLAIFFSTWPPFRPFFALGLALFTGVVLWEFYRLAISKGFDPLDKIGVITGMSYILSLFLLDQAFWLPYFIFAFSVGWSFFYLMKKGREPLINLSVTYFGLIYCAIPLGFIVLIDHSQSDPRLWLLYAVAVAKLTDMGAFFGGLFLGRRLLAPSISPKKTVEGAIIGVAVAASASFCFGALLTLDWISCLLLGLAIGALAQFGDATESLLKRDAGIKDSNAIPGLGGLLDMVDSLVFVLPLVYIYIQIMES